MFLNNKTNKDKIQSYGFILLFILIIKILQYFRKR
jgi:hypothetical protein